MSLRKLALLAMAASLALAVGCGRQDLPAEPAGGAAAWDKDGSEALGAPSIAIAAGTGVAEGGVSMIGVDAADLSVTVPAGATIEQVLLYWAGGTTSRNGDSRITVDGVRVTGALIGGPTFFYEYDGEYRFSAYRADITSLGLVAPGPNVLTISDFHFGDTLVDENNGVSVVVIWSDGPASAITLRDGLDMAYFEFPGLLNSTVPQVFAVEPAPFERTAELVVLAGSVGQDRANRIVVTTSAGEQVFEDPMGGFDGPQWDSLKLPVVVPAGAASVTVELVSPAVYAPLGASLGWVCAALVLPAAVDQGPYTVTGSVFTDTNENGQRDADEPGLPGVVVDLSSAAGATGQTALTDADGAYSFAVGAGAWTVTVDTAGHQDAFNQDLGAWFIATTPQSRAVTTGPGSAGNDFGFIPDSSAILAGIRGDELDTNGYTRETWRVFFRCAIHARGMGHHGQDGAPGGSDHDGGERHEGFRGHRLGDSCGCAPGEPVYDEAELLGLLLEVEGLFLPVPFQFGDGRELREAYRLLGSREGTLEGRVEQELLVAELNYVVGRGIVGHEDLLAAILAWAESLLVWEEDGAAKVGEKDRASRLGGVLEVLEAVNTGGGGGVDE